MQTEESFYSNDNVDVTMFNFLTPRKVGYLRSEERVLFYGTRRSSSLDTYITFATFNQPNQ